MAGGDSTLKELLELAGGGDNKKAKFTHKQEVSDKAVKAFIGDGTTSETRSLLSEKHNAHFRITEMSGVLRETPKSAGEEKKMAAMQNLTNEIFARALSSAFVLSAVLLVHRVEINILGRQMDDESEGAAGHPAFAAFVETGKHVADKSLGRIADAARAGFQEAVARSSLTPKTKVTAHEIERHFSDACSHVCAELFTGHRCVETLLPESIAIASEAKGLLDEARDALESPQFLVVLRAVVAAVVRQIVADLASDGKGGPSPLTGASAVPLAKLLARMTDLSNAVLGGDADNENAYIAQAAGEPALLELCEALYFQEAAR